MSIYDSIQNMMEIKQKYKHFTVFLKIVFQILVIAHLAGCFFIKLGLNNMEKKNWINALDISYEDHFNIYISAIYWSIITMITVGYGDITPKNQSNDTITTTFTIMQAFYFQDEKIYVIFVSLISCGIFGYSLNIIGQIIRTKEESKLKFQNKINEITVFLKKRQVNRDMREKIFKYYHYLHKEELRESHQVNIMMGSLPESLKSSFVIELYYKIIKSSQFFEETFSENFILQMCSIIKEKRVGPEMDLMDINKNNDSQSQTSERQRLFFILNGKVSCETSSKKERIIQTFEKGECIGLQEFVTGQKTDLNPVWKTQSVVMIAYIDRGDFLNLLEDFPQDKEKFYMTKDKIQFKEDIKLCKSKCYSCQSEHHRFSQCDRLHLQVNKDKILYIVNTSKTQERNIIEMTRTTNKSKNALSYLVYAQEESLGLQNNPEFNQAKKDYITQYTVSQTSTSNQLQFQFQAQKTNQLLQQFSKQTSNNRKYKKKHTVPNRAMEGSLDTKRQIQVKIKEPRIDGSQANANSAFDLDTIQNRQKRSVSDMQFGADFLGSHQILSYLGPVPSSSSVNTGTNNNNTMNVMTPHTSHGVASFLQAATEFSHHQPIQKEINLAARNNLYFNKEYEDDKSSVGPLSEKREDELNHSINSFYQKKNTYSKSQKKIKVNTHFNMDDIKKKMPLTQNLKYFQGGPSQPEAQMDIVQGDDGNYSMNTFNQLPVVLTGSFSCLPQQFGMKVQNEIPKQNTSMNENQEMSISDDLYQSDDDEEDDENAKNQIQQLEQQIILMKESKVMDIDIKKEYVIYFPESNSEIIIFRQQKANTQINKSPFRGYRKVSRFKQVNLSPLPAKRR